MTCEDTQEDTPPRASTLPNFSHIEHKMPSRLTCGALLAAGLLSSGLSAANAEVLYEYDGTIPKMTVEDLDPWVADATCVKVSAELTSGMNDKFIIAVFTTDNAKTIGTNVENDAYTTAEALGDAVMELSLEYCSFEKSARCDTIVTTAIGTSYTAGFANGNDVDLKGKVRLETCSSDAETLIEAEATLGPWDMVRSPTASGLTCATVTMTLPETDQMVVAGVFLEADADTIENKARAGEYTDADQVKADFETDALTGSLCTFGESATCTFRATLDPEKSYVAGVANGNTEGSVTGTVVVKTCTDAEALEDGLTSNPAVDADSDMGKATTATTSADTQLIVVSGAAGFYPRVAFAATLAATLFLAM